MILIEPAIGSFYRGKVIQKRINFLKKLIRFFILLRRLDLLEKVNEGIFKNQ